ncbi:MAG: hypothetical protein ACFFFG_01880 [Candidatus Thorarchaeota archaeon]
MGKVSDDILLGPLKQDKETEKTFVKAFIAYWKIIREHLVTDLTQVTFKCKLLYHTFTKPFIEQWEERVPIISTSDEYIRDYHSFELTVRAGAHILIPHKLVVYESMRPFGKLYHHIERISTIKELLFFLERSCREISFPLNKSDVIIIRKLTSRGFIGSSRKIPTFKKLAEICGVHKNTIARHFPKMIDSYILSIIYKVDPSIAGYETFVIIDQGEDPEVEEIDYILAMNPYEKNLADYRLTIFQLPQKKSALFHRIKTKSNTILFQSLSNEYIGWNLRSLTTKSKGRWEFLPPILSVHSWDERIRGFTNGVTLNLQPYHQTPHLTPLDKKMLDFYAIHNMLEDIEVAKKLNVSEKYVRQSRVRIIKEGLIKLFVDVSNIGVTYKPWITIIGERGVAHYNILWQVLEHLKFFPFARLFYDFNGPTQIITGYMYMPEHWVNDFLYKWSELTQYGLRTEINLSYSRFIKWSVNITRTNQ